MKLGVFAVLLQDKDLDSALKYLKEQGVQAVEIGCGGYPGKSHCDPAVLLSDAKKFDEFKATIDKYGMEISALSVHGNPVHPQKILADEFNKDFENAVLLAEKLNVKTVVTFSGCPGDSDGSKYPNWVTCPWPPDFMDILTYQWDEVLVPYWKTAVAFAKKHNVNQIALEMHPGFCVYNPESLLKLRNAVGPEIGANFDPSHLVWQGIDPTVAIKNLKGCIFHFHAKDIRVDKYNAAANGVLDVKHYGDVMGRSWSFRSVGYGNSTAYWKDLVSTLRTVDYDFVISIEHEDALMSATEGLKKAIDCLKESITFEDKGEMWWA